MNSIETGAEKRQILRVDDTVVLEDGRIGVIGWSEDHLRFEVYVSRDDEFLHTGKKEDLFRTIAKKVASGYSKEVTELFDKIGVGSREAMIRIGKNGKSFVAPIDTIAEFYDEVTRDGRGHLIEIAAIPNGGSDIHDLRDALASVEKS